MRKRPSSRLASKLPPSSAARSRMPTRPCAVGLVALRRRIGLVTVSSSASGRTRPRPPRCPLRGGRRWSAPPAGSGRRPGRRQAASGRRSPSSWTTTASPEVRWRSTSVSSAASPGAARPRSRCGAVLAQNADELVDLAQRLACDLLDRLERGSGARRDRCSCSSRAAPAWTRITLIAWPAESCRSRAMRVRSSAAARRRSRSVSRSARSARSSVRPGAAALTDAVAERPRRRPRRQFRTGAARREARRPPIPAAATWMANMPTTVAAVSRSPARVSARVRARGRRARPSGRAADRARIRARSETALAAAVNANTARGARRRRRAAARRARPGRRRADRGRVCRSAEPPRRAVRA